MANYKLIETSTGLIKNIIEIVNISEYSVETGYSLELVTSSFEWTGSSYPQYTSAMPYAGGFVGIFSGRADGQFIGDAILDNASFSTSPTASISSSRLLWNDGDGTLDLGLKGENVTVNLGQQQYAMAYNAQGSTLNKGDVVYISGSQGNRIAIKKSNNSSEVTSKDTLGFVAETITAGSEGFILTSGQLKGLNTNGLTEGATVYLGSTDGSWTTTKPTSPNHKVILGFIQRAHATVGSIFVKVDNGYELDELHNLLDTSTDSTYGDLLVKSGSLWINSKQLTGSYGVTGSVDISGELKINGTTYTASTSGTSGTSGAAGSSGTSGTSGSSGTSGTSGSSGAAGSSGSSGTRGTSGSSGTSGTAGSSGTSGTGSPGSSGSSGTSGTGFSTISNFTNDRVLTSDGTSNAANAEANLTFTGTNLYLTGSFDISGSITMNSNALNNPLLTGYYETMITKSVANDFGGGIVNIDLKLGNVHKLLLDANVMDLNISNNPAAGQAGSFVLVLEGDGTARTFSWGTEITWPNGAPSVVTTDNNLDIYSFITFNQTEYVGFVIAQNQSGLV